MRAWTRTSCSTLPISYASGCLRRAPTYRRVLPCLCPLQGRRFVSRFAFICLQQGDARVIVTWQASTCLSTVGISGNRDGRLRHVWMGFTSLPKLPRATSARVAHLVWACEHADFAALCESLKR